MNTTPTTETAERHEAKEANRDPLSGAPGAHPVGVGVGAAGAGAAGAAAGMAVGGPAGAVIGGAIGAVAGGLAGKGVAEAIDPTIEESFWREAHHKQPYADPTMTIDDYLPAYRSGYMGYGVYAASSSDFAIVEPELERDFNANRGQSRLKWEQAREASRAAWERAEQRKSTSQPRE